MQMVMFTKGIGRMIRLMAGASILTLMVLAMRVSGGKTSNMDKALNAGQMVPVTKELMWTAKSTEREDSSGQTRAHILEISTITTLKAKEYMNGLMEEFTTENGKATKCKVMELSPGLMEEDMLGSISMI